MNNKISLYINTLKYLKPSQVYYRVSNKVKREFYKRNLLTVKIPKEINVEENCNYIIPELDFNIEYLNRFDTNNILKDTFTFINKTYRVPLSNAWNNKELQHLWRYNLHYFEYLFKLSWEYSKDNEIKFFQKYKQLIRNWIENNPFPYGDGWHPYTISLRITNWISTYQIFKEEIKLDNDFHKTFKESLYLQYKYLRSNLEKDVLGNHYFENIKAIIMGSVFFIEPKVKEIFKKELLKQLEEQILEDGMHFELSPMYHKIVLEDLIKISYWLKDDKIHNNLIQYIQKMIDVTYSFERNFGKTPSFNDSTDGVGKSYKSLLEVCRNYFLLNPRINTRLEKSGFYIIEEGFKKIIFDTGEICPSFLPAHGHCDALSFELSIDGSPFIVNSGTYKYESGRWRNYFRSTQAHNTITISDKEQSEFWGSFRVARRINKVRRKEFNYKDIEFYAGAFRFSNDIEEHKRYIGSIDKGTFVVLDFVYAKSNENIKSYLHFVPEVSLEIKDNLIEVVKSNFVIKITPIGVSNITVGQGWYSEQFNSKKENRHLIFNKDRNKKVFGYLINLNTKVNDIILTDDELKLVSDKEVIININNLGEMI